MGVCIDLSKMRGVIVDTDARTITAEGGALWSDVNIEAEKHGLATVGGMVDHTGIGGLTLGGGFGYLSGRHGLVIDNLLSVELVLADGEVVTASATENRDLFWAVRGAGWAFGVVTKFVYRAHEQDNQVWGGLLVFSPLLLEKVVAFANTVMEEGNEDKTILAGFGAPFPEGKPMLMVAVFYNGGEEEAREFYKPLLRLGPLVNTTKAMRYPEMNAMMNHAMEPGIRRRYVFHSRQFIKIVRPCSFKGSAFLAPLNLEFAQGIFEDFASFLENTPDAAMSVILFEFVPFHKIQSIEQSATAYANRGAYGNLAFVLGWHDAANDDKVREWARMIAGKARKELERRVRVGSLDRNTRSAVGEYVNYDSKSNPLKGMRRKMVLTRTGLDESAVTLFGKNTARLTGLKRKYDSENVFSKGPRLLG
jgi:hypothetical protein